MHFMAVPGKHQIIFTTGNHFSEPAGIIAMQQRDALTPERDIPKTPMKGNTDVRREKLPVAGMDINISEDGMHRYPLWFENTGQLRQYIHTANVTAVEDGIYTGFTKSCSGLCRSGNIPMRIGKNPNFHAGKLA